MNVITPRTLRAFWEKHPQAETPLRVWLKRMRKNSYRTVNDVRADFPTADLATGKNGSALTIFNISGNNVRLVVVVSYSEQRVYIRHVMTHAEYDKRNAQERPE
jgi:mRNA interferase HigB